MRTKIYIYFLPDMTRRIVHDGLHRDGLHHDAHHHDGLHREVLQHHEYEGHRHDGPSHEERQQGQRPEHSDDGLLDNEVGDVGNARTFCNTILYLKGTVSQDFCPPPPHTQGPFRNGQSCFESLPLEAFKGIIRQNKVYGGNQLH